MKHLKQIVVMTMLISASLSFSIFDENSCVTGYSSCDRSLAISKKLCEGTYRFITISGTTKNLCDKYCDKAEIAPIHDFDIPTGLSVTFLTEFVKTDFMGLISQENMDSQYSPKSAVTLYKGRCIETYFKSSYLSITVIIKRTMKYSIYFEINLFIQKIIQARRDFIILYKLQEEIKPCYNQKSSSERILENLIQTRSYLTINLNMCKTKISELEIQLENLEVKHSGGTLVINTSTLISLKTKRDELKVLVDQIELKIKKIDDEISVIIMSINQKDKIKIQTIKEIEIIKGDKIIISNMINGNFTLIQNYEIDLNKLKSQYDEENQRKLAIEAKIRELNLEQEQINSSKIKLESEIKQLSYKMKLQFEFQQTLQHDLVIKDQDYISHKSTLDTLELEIEHYHHEISQKQKTKINIFDEFTKSRLEYIFASSEYEKLVSLNETNIKYDSTQYITLKNEIEVQLVKFKADLSSIMSQEVSNEKSIEEINISLTKANACISEKKSAISVQERLIYDHQISLNVFKSKCQALHQSLAIIISSAIDQIEATRGKTEADFNEYIKDFIQSKVDKSVSDSYELRFDDKVPSINFFEEQKYDTLSYATIDIQNTADFQRETLDKFEKLVGSSFKSLQPTFSHSYFKTVLSSSSNPTFQDVLNQIPQVPSKDMSQVPPKETSQVPSPPSSDPITASKTLAKNPLRRRRRLRKLRRLFI